MEESPRARVEPETNTTLNTNEVKLESLVRDPGVQPLLSSYPSNQQDEIRQTYIRLGPYQLVKAHYPLSPCGFKSVGFKQRGLEAESSRGFRRPCATAPLAHPSETLLFRRFWWLEYSDEKDAAFCFPCYLFGRKHIGRAGSDTFIAKGFNNWRKVNSGTACPFVNQEGKAPTSAHNFFVRCYEDLKNKVCHIENVIDKQTEQEIMDMMRLSLYFNKKFYNSLLSAPNRCSIVKARHEGCYHSLGE
nr:hypothetical protein [Tanacetum cinerariifolium]